MESGNPPYDVNELEAAATPPFVDSAQFFPLASVAVTSAKLEQVSECSPFIIRIDVARGSTAFGQFVKLPVHAAAVDAKLDAARYIKDPGTTGELVPLGVTVCTGVVVGTEEVVGVPVAVEVEVTVPAGDRDGVIDPVGVVVGVSGAGGAVKPNNVDNCCATAYTCAELIA